MNTKTITKVAILLYMIQLGGCMNIQNPSREKPGDEKQWIYLSAEVITLHDSTQYYYYGQVDASKVKLLNEKDAPLFFTLENIRYWNDSDKLEIYEDSSWLGTKFFRTEDIVKIDLLKNDPVFTFDTDDLAENALRFKNSRKNNLSSK